MHNHWGWMTTTDTGTGSTISLTAKTGFPTISAIVGSNRLCRYAIRDNTTGAPIASGLGTISGTTLTRGAAETSYLSSTYTPYGSVASLPSGTKDVFVSAMSNDLSPAIPAVQGIVGQKLVHPNGLVPSNQTKTLVANVVYASCLIWNCGRPISAMSMAVSTLAGTGSDRIQLGIYACKEDGSAGNLIMRTGDILPNTTGLKSSSINGGTQELPPGCYWFAMCSSVAPVVQAYDAGSYQKATESTPMGNASADLYNRYCYLSTAAIGSGWTALPSTITLTGGQTINNDFAPMAIPVVT